MDRAWKTAEAIAAHHPHLTIQPEPRMRELHFGDWEGRFWQDINRKEEKLVQKWRRDASSITLPNGESMAKMAARVKVLLTTLVSNILMIPYSLLHMVAPFAR